MNLGQNRFHLHLLQWSCSRRCSRSTTLLWRRDLAVVKTSWGLTFLLGLLTCSDEIKEACRDYQKYLKFCSQTATFGSLAWTSKDILVISYRYIRYPTAIPAKTPQNTASGNEVAGRLRPTPPTNTTASRPSRSTVMNGRRNIA